MQELCTVSTMMFFVNLQLKLFSQAIDVSKKVLDKKEKSTRLGSDRYIVLLHRWMMERKRSSSKL